MTIRLAHFASSTFRSASDLSYYPHGEAEQLQFYSVCRLSGLRELIIEESVFDSYHIIEETFKTVHSHDIHTAVLIPRGLKPGLHPIIYQVHGGFLVTAHGLFAPFFPKWVDRLALQHSAIIVSPDHRLLPSENGIADLLEDVEDGWNWTKANLRKVIRQSFPDQDVDFSRVLLAGGSAGGYCAIQLGFSHPLDFRVVSAIYPLLDTMDHVFVEGPRLGEPNVLRMPLDQQPSKAETLAWIEEKRKQPHTRDRWDRTPFAVAACHHGVFTSHILNNKNLDSKVFNPVEQLEGGKKLPLKLWIMHGDDDSTVHVRGTHKFVEILKRKLPEVTLRLDIIPGQDHAFDFNEGTWAATAPEAMKFVEEAWLS